ncbi:DUF2771 family protein [Williamsia sterculiae]|uniref:DUF2771 domain-containing protein n=1 Tax=Williamsia sterculiae TaxID=1344003 RepID=A0A1N7GW01_9NOCA|nr:DUF2771 family protein [Williamsia sterculiae]SIS16765.1 Protein of unknown function [Williamsia sterculiae]
MVAVSSGEKKALAIILVVAVVFVAVVGGLVFALTSGHDDPDEPYLQVTSGSHFARVRPSVWCDVKLEKCDPPAGTQARRPAAFPVQPGDTLMLSVSADIASGPWFLVTQYATPRGVQEPGIAVKLSKTTYTEVLRSTADRTLVSVEVQVPSAVAVGDQTNVRGYLSLDTTPYDRKK